MADSFLSNPAAPKLEPVIFIRRLVIGMATLTWFLMALGSTTRVMNAGLACPDWPLCYGTLVPQQQMNLQVFLEWFHRLVASMIGLLTIALVGLTGWHHRSLPNWLPWGATLALGLVIFQGVLGGLTVTQLLRFDIVTAHLATGLLFFSTLLAMAMALIPYRGTGAVGKLPWVSVSAAGLVYLQSILGGLVASRWALHQCFGNSQLCAVMNSHILGVLPPTLAVLILIFLARRTPALHPTLRRLTIMIGGLLGLQIALGVMTFRLQLQVALLTVAHQGVGAALLGTLVAFSVIALRDGWAFKHPTSKLALNSRQPGTQPMTS